MRKDSYQNGFDETSREFQKKDYRETFAALRESVELGDLGDYERGARAALRHHMRVVHPTAYTSGVEEELA